MLEELLQGESFLQSVKPRVFAGDHTGILSVSSAEVQQAAAVGSPIEVSGTLTGTAAEVMAACDGDGEAEQAAAAVGLGCPGHGPEARAEVAEEVVVEDDFLEELEGLKEAVYGVKDLPKKVRRRQHAIVKRAIELLATIDLSPAAAATLAEIQLSLM